ncbi:MAG: ATP cone domain-containing protein [Candidatus Colwellbacteria bacterium]|nr:ATP cone domain-containing protein [Candidatus Colwellbacteria bacterium]
MIHSVLKRGARDIEPFIPDKIRSSIGSAIRDSGIVGEKEDELTRKIHYEVVSSLPPEQEITTETIRSVIMETLSSIDDREYRTVIMASWVEHERRFKSF